MAFGSQYIYELHHYFSQGQTQILKKKSNYYKAHLFWNVSREQLITISLLNYEKIAAVLDNKAVHAKHTDSSRSPEERQSFGAV